jgi:transcriptional regulator with XRE-family HTH domain
MCRTENGVVRYAPLCVHSFRLIAPRKLLEAQLFNRQYHSYEEIENVPDRLRWCRHSMGLAQKEVAKLVGITRGHYTNLETGAVDHYEKETVDKLADLFRVPPADFLDDYNLFLYQGQGEQLRAYRLCRGWNLKQMAEWLKVEPNMLRVWETGKKCVTKASWERYLKGKLQ